MKIADLTWLPPRYQVKTLIDIGAHNGEYGNFLRGLFQAETAHAFEPMPQYTYQLKSLGFQVHPVALGKRAGQSAAFFIHKNDAASSLLDSTSILQTEYPRMAAVSKRISVPVERLDDAIEEISPDLLVKIDAQGAEREIIQGGQRVLGMADIVLIEKNYVAFYEGQALFNELHGMLDDLGLQLQGFRSLHMAKKDRRPLFSHCIYCRTIKP